MADGTKAVVETPAADEAAPAVGVEEERPDVPEEPGAAAAGEPAEVTAPLSKDELAAELGAPVAPAKRGSGRKPSPAPDTEPGMRTSTETLDADTATLPAALPAPEHHSGDTIAGRYRLEECITQSDAFSSWRAVDEKLRRAVGVHLLSAGHRRAKAVLTAARSAALLGDVRFVQVLDAVQVGELVYVIREWLPGASDLATLLADGPMEPYDAYQMVKQTTEAIAAAHERGQAHLRLTPRCVLRTETGQYRINGIAVDAALRGLPVEDAELTDTRAIGALLYAALTHRWPYPEDRYDLQGLPKSLGCVPPDQVKAGIHKGLAELAARILCEHPPHHQEPITTPGQLAKAIALMPKVRPPEPPAPPTYSRPRYPSSAPTQQLRPAHTAPAPVPPAPVAPAPSGRRRGLRRAVKWTASLVALAAIGVGSWQLVHRLSHSSRSSAEAAPAVQSSSSPSSRPVGAKLTVASLSNFNAFGDSKDEHGADLPKVIDGNPDTFWATQSFSAQFGTGYRPGDGFLVDLGSARTVSSVDLQFSGAHSVELHAAAADATTPPAADENGFKSLGPSLASGTGTKVTLKPEQQVTTRYLLIWLTSIPNDGSGYQGKVAEMTVNG